MAALVFKLKRLYYNRKLNPAKKGKAMRPLKKRYICGICEVLKHLQAENLKMVIMATNLEKVKEERGLDEKVNQIVSKCREQQIPLVFSGERYQLGKIAKSVGQMVSTVGVFNYQGANEEFNSLVEEAKHQREEFYKKINIQLGEV